MEMNRTLAAVKPNGGSSPPAIHHRPLLDALAAIRWDLKNALLEGEACPEELANNIGRVFDEIDASIRKLDAIDRKADLAR